MKYIITESQNKRVRFMRRTSQHPVSFIRERVSWLKNPCKFHFFGAFINFLQDEVIEDWMEQEDIDFIQDYVYGEMYHELQRYYNNKCK